MRFRCRTEPRGFYSVYPIYSPLASVEITSIIEAADEAERQFGSDWHEVYSESEHIRRSDYDASRVTN
jgi:hypothetical protein